MSEAQRKKATEQADLPPNETISSSYAAIQKKRGKPDDLGVYRATRLANLDRLAFSTARESPERQSSMRVTRFPLA